MQDPQIKVKVIADFLYKEGVYAIAGTYLSFDIYDSYEVTQLLDLYSPNYEYKEYIELPNPANFPLHVKERYDDVFGTELRIADASDSLPPSQTLPYGIDEDIYAPFAPSPAEKEDYLQSLQAPQSRPLEMNVQEPVFIEEQSVQEQVDVQYVKYSQTIQELLALSEEQLSSHTAASLKKALAEVNPNYVYTNKQAAIEHLMTYK